MSTLIIRGNVTADAELTYGQSGAARLTFTVAENIRQNKNGEWVDVRTDFHRVTVWRKAAETLAGHLRKGTSVLVLGDLESRTVEKDDRKTTYWGIAAREVGIIPRAESQPRPQQSQQPADDPWAPSQQQPQQGGGWDEPTF